MSDCLSDESIKKIINTVLGTTDDDSDLIEPLLRLWKRGKNKLGNLYGDETDLVISKCLEVSPFFCFQVLTNVYGIWWSNTIISDYEKSIVTLVALLVTKQMKQFDVLQKTFFVSGGKRETLKAIIDYMNNKKYITHNTYDTVLNLTNDADASTLNEVEIYLIEIAANTALENSLDFVIQHKPAQWDQTKVLVSINHLLTYLGCPPIWNATSSIKS